LIFALATSTPPLRALEPRINEFVADNQNGLSDADHDEVDWVEIYNPNPVAQDLTGWYLTDDLTQPAQWWQFPATSINPNGYLVVFASGKDRRPPGGELHTNSVSGRVEKKSRWVKPDGVTVGQPLCLRAADCRRVVRGRRQ
jgi:hypothetical protein